MDVLLLKHIWLNDDLIAELLTSLAARKRDSQDACLMKQRLLLLQKPCANQG